MTYADSQAQPDVPGSSLCGLLDLDRDRLRRWRRFVQQSTEHYSCNDQRERRNTGRQLHSDSHGVGRDPAAFDNPVSNRAVGLSRELGLPSRAGECRKLF